MSRRQLLGSSSPDSPGTSEAFYRTLTASPLRLSILIVVSSFLLAITLSVLLCSSSPSSFLSFVSPRHPIPLVSIIGHDSRSSSLIVKLNATTGEWLPYEGITIIMRVMNRSDLPIYQSLYSQVAAFPVMSPLATDSLHVTLSNVLPRTSFHTLSNYNDLIRLYHPRFERLSAAYSLLPHRPLVFTAAEPKKGTSGLSFTLHPKTDGDREVLRGYEELTREVLGSAYVWNDRYHMGIGYMKLKQLKKVDQSEWDEFLQKVTQLLEGTDLVVGPPELCKSVTMLQFDKL